MRILMVSKALVLRLYHRKLEAIGRQPGIELTAVVPPSWRDAGRVQPLEWPQPLTPGRDGLCRAEGDGYRLIVAPVAFNGHFHWHFYPALGRIMTEVRPNLVHLDEEPYNLATAHGAWLARRLGARFLFFTWQNLYRRYPPPWSWLERFVYNRSDAAIAGNQQAVSVLWRKGYRGPVTVIPQFGFDLPVLSDQQEPGDRPFTIGFAGRLVEQKGVWLLLDAVAGLPGNWQLILIGEGPLRPALEAWVQEQGWSDRVTFRGWLPSTQITAELARLDCLVAPSLTRRNWKEQFGRVLVEAMAVQVPVVGSDSGEIPNVIGDAGLIVPEGNASALREALARLQADPALRRQLGIAGRARVQARFTQARIAEATVALYQLLA